MALLLALLFSTPLLAQTKYLAFQVWPALPGYPGIPPTPGHLSLGKAQMEGFVRDVVKAIGTTGDARHKLVLPWGRFVSICPTRKRASGSAMRLRSRGRTTWPWLSTLMIR